MKQIRKEIDLCISKIYQPKLDSSHYYPYQILRDDRTFTRLQRTIILKYKILKS